MKLITSYIIFTVTITVCPLILYQTGPMQQIMLCIKILHSRLALIKSNGILVLFTDLFLFRATCFQKQVVEVINCTIRP